MHFQASTVLTTDLDKAGLSSSNQQLSINPVGARIGFVLEARQGGHRLARVRVIDYHPGRGRDCIVVGVGRAEIDARDSANLSHH